MKVTVKSVADAAGFVSEAFLHCKPIAASSAEIEPLQAAI